MASETCKNCDRTVLVLDVGGERFVTDPELIMVVTARERPLSQRQPGRGAIQMSSGSTWARRIHSDLCETYKQAGEREKIQREQREYNRRNGRGKTPRRNHGL